MKSFESETQKSGSGFVKVTVKRGNPPASEKELRNMTESMLDVRGSIANLKWNTEHHYLHIKNQHDFIRIWAIQFELGYSDFRTIQMALQLANRSEMLKDFTRAYDAVYRYEYAFVQGGLEGFNQQFGTEIDAYDKAHQSFLAVLDELSKTQPAPDGDENLV